MKFFHLADLHLGRKLLGESLIEEQSYILEEIMKNVRVEKPDGIFICGDIYDKYIPSSEAVALFDSFLEAIAKVDCEVFVISGNHDGASRLEFASGLLKKQKVHICGTYKGKIESVELKDEYGNLRVYLLPFLRPDMLRPYEKNCPKTYHEAVKQVLEKLPYNKKERSLLLTHQFVVHGQMFPETSESEQKLVGGIEAVDVSCFEKFDYTALGHLHRAQKIKQEWIRYAGSPLAYSFSEANDKKGITVVELKEKGTCLVRTILLQPKTKLAVLKDTLKNLLSETYQEFQTGYYLSIRVTDEEMLEYPVQRLQQTFSGMLECRIENRRMLSQGITKSADLSVLEKKPKELFAEFYEKQNEVPMNEIEKMILKQVLDEMEETTGDTN